MIAAALNIKTNCSDISEDFLTTPLTLQHDTQRNLFVAAVTASALVVAVISFNALTLMQTAARHCDSKSVFSNQRYTQPFGADIAAVSYAPSIDIIITLLQRMFEVSYVMLQKCVSIVI